jgi:hypothetical protein
MRRFRQLPFAGITQIRFKGISHPSTSGLRNLLLLQSPHKDRTPSVYTALFQTSWAGFYTFNCATCITNFQELPEKNATEIRARPQQSLMHSSTSAAGIHHKTQDLYLSKLHLQGRLKEAGKSAKNAEKITGRM